MQHSWGASAISVNSQAENNGMTTGALKEEDCRLRAGKAHGIQDSGFGIQENNEG